MTLAELDSRMADLAQIRREIVRSYFEGGKPQREAALLAEIRQDLGPDRRRPFETETGDRIDLDLSYETEELERDLLFVSEGEEAVWSGIAGDAGPASQAAGIARHAVGRGCTECGQPRTRTDQQTISVAVIAPLALHDRLATREAP